MHLKPAGHDPERAFVVVENRLEQEILHGALPWPFDPEHRLLYKKTSDTFVNGFPVEFTRDELRALGVGVRNNIEGSLEPGNGPGFGDLDDEHESAQAMFEKIDGFVDLKPDLQPE